MDRKLKLSKAVVLDSSTPDVKQKALYDALLAELQQNIRGQNTTGHFWHLHKSQNTDLYKGLSASIYTYALGIFNAGTGFDVSIVGRQNIMIPLIFSQIEIIDFNFNNQATFSVYFKSNEFHLLESIGSALLLSHDKTFSFLVDIDDRTISITEYKQV